MSSMVGIHIRYGLMGLAMGLILSAIGFADYDELFNMFTLTDLRMLLAFATAVALSALVLGLLHVRKIIRYEKKHYHPGIIPGSILFGYGWVMCGACPSIVFIQLGQGKIVALITLVGIFLGVRTYRALHARYLHWDTGTCGL